MAMCMHNKWNSIFSSVPYRTCGEIAIWSIGIKSTYQLEGCSVFFKRIYCCQYHQITVRNEVAHFEYQQPL